MCSLVNCLQVKCSDANENTFKKRDNLPERELTLIEKRSETAVQTLCFIHEKYFSTFYSFRQKFVAILAVIMMWMLVHP